MPNPLHDKVKHKIDGWVEYYENVRKILYDFEPLWPVGVVAVDCLVKGGYEFPEVACQIEADDAEWYPGESGLLGTPVVTPGQAPPDPAAHAAEPVKAPSNKLPSPSTLASQANVKVVNSANSPFLQVHCCESIPFNKEFTRKLGNVSTYKILPSLVIGLKFKL